MKILFLSKRLLFPTDRGGLVRTLNVVRHLSQWHDLTFLSNQQPGQEEDCLEMTRLGLRLVTVPWEEVSRSNWRFYRDLARTLFSAEPFNAAKDYDPAFRKRARQLLDETRHDVLICDFVQMARNAIGIWDGPSVLFEHNVEAEIFERHSQTTEGHRHSAANPASRRTAPFRPASHSPRVDSNRCPLLYRSHPHDPSCSAARTDPCHVHSPPPPA